MNPTTKSRLAFLFGLGSVTQIRIVGAMGITEAVCILLAPLIVKKYWTKIKAVRAHRYVGFLSLWFISAILSDLYRETSMNNALKGIFALPFLFAAFVVAFALLWDDLMRVRWIVLGTAISGTISIYAFQSGSLIGLAERGGDSISEVMTFKSIYAGVLLFIIGALIVLYYRRWPIFVMLLLLVASGVFLAQGFRNGFLTLFISAVGAWLAKKHFEGFRTVQKNVVVMFISIAIVGVAATEIYSYSVQQGWLGKEELNKYRMQSQSEMGLLSGRSGFFAALFVIKDTPVLGLGSWAVDKGYNAEFYEYLGDREGLRYLRSWSQSRELYAPAHSHLMQAWVWHGIFGGLFWMFVLMQMFQYFRHALHLCRPLIAYNLLYFIGALWDVLFSPFSQRIRWGIVFTIIVLSLAEVDRRRRKKKAGSALDVNAPWDGKWSR